MLFRLPTLTVLSTLLVQALAIGTSDIVLAEQLTTGAAAVSLAKGTYHITNVKTGQKLTFIAKHGKAKFPSLIPRSGAGSPVTVIPHGGGSSKPWYQLEAGNNKCLSSAWGGSSNLAAVPYACIQSRGGRNTLEPTKQWWLLTPVSKPTGSVSKTAGQVLLAAQQQSVKTRTAATKAAFGRRFLKRFFKRGEEKHVNEIEKRGGVTSGTFYIIPSDHLVDQAPRALGSGTTSMGGATLGRLVKWNKGDTSQQWRFTRG
jgi:hypothetical protein